MLLTNIVTIKWRSFSIACFMKPVYSRIIIIIQELEALSNPIIPKKPRHKLRLSSHHFKLNKHCGSVFFQSENSSANSRKVLTDWFVGLYLYLRDSGWQSGWKMVIVYRILIFGIKNLTATIIYYLFSKTNLLARKYKFTREIPTKNCH